MTINRVRNKFWRIVHSFHFYAEWSKYFEFYITPAISFHKSYRSGTNIVAFKELYFRIFFLEAVFTKYNR